MWYILTLFAVFAICSPSPAELVARYSAFPGGNAQPEGWKLWAPRDEIAPSGSVDSHNSVGEPGALVLNGGSNPGVFGGWTRREPVEPGAWYELRSLYRTAGVQHPQREIVARLDWFTAAGKRTGQPDYAGPGRPHNKAGWYELSVKAPAPADARFAELQLLIVNAPKGTVWWDEIALERLPEPKPRVVTVASINLRPSRLTPEQNVDAFIRTADAAVKKADVILMPEGITVVGTGKKYPEVAEPVPGPTTAKLGLAAKRHGAWIVAGIYEREGPVIYNTAVLIDRQGRLAGKYRKVYLPREEVEAGLTPGDSYPVFETDFGTVGLMICYDVFFADPARALALRGAELLLMPIWGGNETLGKARAIEHKVFVASSGYDYPSMLVDPDGAVLAVAKDQGSAAVATIDLSKRYTDRWLGDMKGRYRKELRLDVPVVPSLAEIR